MKILTLLFLHIFPVLINAQQTLLKEDSLLENIAPRKTKNLEFPFADKEQKILSHSAYSFVYNEKHEQAAWVAYELTKSETIKNSERTNKFLPDPAVSTNTASNTDYLKSGYDRGHLAPAADMAWSSTTMAESFYYSNMSPQDPAFNRGKWKQLEELVRNWAIENDTIYVVTGPVLKDNLPAIGDEKVSVPEFFFKVVLDYSSPHIKAIAFILPNKKNELPLENYAISIDSAEKFVGLDFFCDLPDEQELIIENHICIDCWSWKKETVFSAGNDSLNLSRPQNNSLTEDPGFSETPAQNKSGESVQCSEFTKKGNRCKRMTRSANGKCYQHGGN